MKKIEDKILTENREDLLKFLVNFIKENPLDKENKITNHKYYKDISCLLDSDAEQISRDTPSLMNRFQSFIKMCKQYPELCDENKNVNKGFLTQYIAEIYKQTSSKSFGGVAGMLFITAIDLNKYNISMDDINSSLEQYKITPNIQKIEQSNSSNGVKKIRI